MPKNDENLDDEKSTDEVDEETQDESKVDEVDTEAQTDEQAENEDESDEETEDSDSKEEESEDETSDKAEFEKRFPRFKGETLDEYVKNLEEGYANSYEQYKKVRAEADEWKNKAMSVVAKGDESDDDTEKPVPPAKKDPALAWAEQQRETAWKKDWQDFVKLHPEIDQDETLFTEFDALTGEMFELIQRKEKRFPSLREAMDKAWVFMNPDSVSKEEQIAMTVKNAGAGTKSKGTPKEQPKPKFSDKQVEMAIRFDPSLKDKTRAEVENILSKYS